MSQLYIVKEGDSLQRISKECMGSPFKSDRIAHYNQIADPHDIYSGQVLKLPFQENISELAHLTYGRVAEHIVNYSETLWSISERYFGTPHRWREIARLNGLANADYIYVGQTLKLPCGIRVQQGHVDATLSHLISSQSVHSPANMVPARAFFFVLADEFNPLTKKYVRKIIIPPELEGNIELFKKLSRPDKYGFFPRDPKSKVSIGRHVLGRTDSNYISLSSKRGGSPRFKGKSLWVNVKKLKASGAKILDAKDIVKDLERISAKTKDANFLKYINEIKELSTKVDKEVLVEGMIHPKFIKGVKMRAFTKGMQFVEGVGIVLTVYDLVTATKLSYEKQSVSPIAAESVRQVGGWGGAFAGFRLGALAGGAFGIETGPGAFLTAAGGGLVGGVAGYFGAEWIAKYIYSDDTEENGK